MANAYQGSHQQYDVIIEKNVMMEVADGVKLAADLYFPAIGGQKAGGQFSTILERTPYNKGAPAQITKGKFFARRGYVCAVQDVFLARTPHGYHDVELIRDELGKAGFSQVSITTLEETSSAPSPRHPAVAYCQGTPLRNEIETRDASLLDYVTDRATKAIEARFGNGPVAGKIRGHIVSAR